MCIYSMQHYITRLIFSLWLWDRLGGLHNNNQIQCDGIGAFLELPYCLICCLFQNHPTIQNTVRVFSQKSQFIPLPQENTTTNKMKNTILQRICIFVRKNTVGICKTCTIFYKIQSLSLQLYICNCNTHTTCNFLCSLVV